VKNILVSLKALAFIIEAVEFKLAADEKRLEATADDDEMADLVNDISFTRVYLKDLKRYSEGWHQLPPEGY
jgi:hypothetical protein